MTHHTHPLIDVYTYFSNESRNRRLGAAIHPQDVTLEYVTADMFENLVTSTEKSQRFTNETARKRKAHRREISAHISRTLRSNNQLKSIVTTTQPLQTRRTIYEDDVEYVQFPDTSTIDPNLFHLQNRYFRTKDRTTIELEINRKHPQTAAIIQSDLDRIHDSLRQAGIRTDDSVPHSVDQVPLRFPVFTLYAHERRRNIEPFTPLIPLAIPLGELAIHERTILDAK
jgi:hypothetical protein